MSPTARAGSPERIWVRLPGWVGDAVMATPALRALRAAHPRAEILAEGARPLLSLLEGLASVDRWIAAPSRGTRALLAHARALRRERIDRALLLPDSARSALAPFVARIPERIGYARDPLRRALLTHRLDPPRRDGKREPISMIERYLRITRAAGCADAGERLDLPVAAAARARVGERLEKAGLPPGTRLAVVTPGASFGASKLWPAEHFARACDELAGRLGLRCVLAPGPGEEAVARRIVALASTAPVCLDAPVTSLTELAALIDEATLVLSNDTGPRHMAVALGTPVITVMGPTDPRHTEHLMERQRVLRNPVECSPCHLKTCPIDHRCMTGLVPGRVLEAAAELMS